MGGRVGGWEVGDFREVQGDSGSGRLRHVLAKGFPGHPPRALGLGVGPSQVKPPFPRARGRVCRPQRESDPYSGAALVPPRPGKEEGRRQETEGRERRERGLYDPGRREGSPVPSPDRGQEGVGWGPRGRTFDLNLHSYTGGRAPPAPPSRRYGGLQTVGPALRRSPAICAPHEASPARSTLPLRRWDPWDLTAPRRWAGRPDGVRWGVCQRIGDAFPYRRHRECGMTTLGKNFSTIPPVPHRP